MKNLIFKFFLKESFVLGLYAMHAISLLVTSSLYYDQLTFDLTENESPGNKKTFGPLDVDAIEKIVNFTGKIFHLYFPQDEDAWRICSILGIGFGIFNLIVTLFIVLIIYLIYIEIKKQAEGPQMTFDPQGIGLGGGTEKCAKAFFITCFMMTLIFSTFSTLTLLATGGLGGKLRLSEPHLTDQLFWAARGFFGATVLPSFMFLVFLITWMVYCFCTGISCGWTTTGRDVIQRTGIFEYIKNNKIKKKPISKDEKINMDSLQIESRDKRRNSDSS